MEVRSLSVKPPTDPSLFMCGDLLGVQEFSVNTITVPTNVSTKQANP